MGNITSFKFNEADIYDLKDYKYGKDWPVVYFQENGNEAYIGEAVNVLRRSKEHLKKTQRQRLHSIHIIADDEYNKSATLDIESWLIQYLVADGTFKLQNGNSGLKNHSYFDREKYRAKFDVIWEELRGMNLASQSLRDLQNSDIFKYSPYKALNDDQYNVVVELTKKIKHRKSKAYLVTGKSGTGKTVLATYLMKHLKDTEETKSLEVALVIPMTSLRKSLKDAFRSIEGLNSAMVIGPSEVAEKKYDLLIVDEAHRLRQRRNITNYATHDSTNRILGFDQDGTELDWVLKQSKQQILFYDSNQSVRPSDVTEKRFKSLNVVSYDLERQMRVEAGEDFINFINQFLEGGRETVPKLKNYELSLYDDIDLMVKDIKNKEVKWGLSRLVAGYAWKWISKKDPAKYDIEIDDVKLRWNSTNSNWINSANAIEEVGCIHTVQGYGLNFVGVIIGKELSYDPHKKEMVFNREFYKDRNGYAGVADDNEVKQYVINIYKTLLSRGIKGASVYIVDENLREHFKEMIGQKKAKSASQTKDLKTKDKINTITDRLLDMIRIPLVGSAPCGNPLLGEENIDEYIEVSKSKLKPKVKYFIVSADGDSMNRAGINDGDLVLCRYSEKAETGDRVVALLGGENVTIKYYDKQGGRRVLLPKSSNPIHKPIFPTEGDEVQGVVQEVLKQ